MCGSALDGEDVVQEALAQAFYNLSSLKDQSRLEPWLFRIAYHNVSIPSFERKAASGRTQCHTTKSMNRSAPGRQTELDHEPISQTLAPLVGELPPKERAAVLLKDVLQYRLEEVAEVVDSTVGGVKAALHRGRAKLRALHAVPSPLAADRRQRELLESYVDCFNDTTGMLFAS